MEQSKNKTRVLVFSSQPSVAKLLLEVLGFHGKAYDSYLENGSTTHSNSDFAIFESSDFEKASAFAPNIALISSEILPGQIETVLESIVAGGVLIYHSNGSEVVENSKNFFRKLEYSGTDFVKSASTFILQTNIGEIPISSSDENLIKNIDGIKLLAQQFGVMEEDFYEALMGFEA